MVYDKELGVAVCSREEVKQSFGRGKEAGTLLESLMKYLEKLAEGR